MSFLLFIIPEFFVTMNALKFHWHMLSVMLGQIMRIVCKVGTIFYRTVDALFLMDYNMCFQFWFLFVWFITVFCKHEYPGIFTWHRLYEVSSLSKKKPLLQSAQKCFGVLWLYRCLFILQTLLRIYLDSLTVSSKFSLNSLFCNSYPITNKYHQNSFSWVVSFCIDTQSR